MTQTDSYVLTNANLATLEQGGKAYGLIEGGAVAVAGGCIQWVGVEVPREYQSWLQLDIQGRLITPGLIDCHTHIVFGGNRALEFEMRLSGASYEEVSRAGGGIVSTVVETRAASVDDLVNAALPRLDSLIAEGVTVVEVKSGYGLDIETELNMLRAARRLGELRAVQVKTSFLGAHAIPTGYQGSNADYITQVCIPALKAAYAEGVVDAVDGFCEGIAFQVDEIEMVFKVAHDLGLPVKLHAEQLSNIGGTKLAAKYGAISVDHLEYADEDDAVAMAAAGSVAVILPGAFYTLHETKLPPIEVFRKHNVSMAVATDGNPGSSPMFSLLLAMNMACTLFRMTPEEALAGATRNAALALGLADTGVIRTGFAADLAIWNLKHPRELAYGIGFNPLYSRIFKGEL